MSETKQKRLSVRRAKPEEMAKVWELERLNLVENWNLHPATKKQISEKEAKKRHLMAIERWYRSDYHEILIACKGSKILGVCWYGIEEDPLFGFLLGYLYSIVIDPEHRRLGIAKRLVNEMKRRSKKSGASFARLAVIHNNEKALNLYRSLGFFDETHIMMSRLEPTGPEKRKIEAKKRKDAASKK